MTNNATKAAVLLAAITGCVAAPADDATEWVTNRVDTAAGSRVLTYQVIGGRAIFEGDIDLGDAAEIAARASSATPEAIVIGGGNYRWPNATIPYVIDPGNPMTQTIQTAMYNWHQQSLFTFVPRTTQTDYVEFSYTPDLGYCWSSVGRVGGEQQIMLTNGCDVAATMHEIGHAIGFWHEQSRGDRDNYITINWNNIETTPVNERPQFEQPFQLGENGSDVFDFDFNSIMLYGSFAFSSNGLPTMVRKSDGGTWSANKTLSQADLQAAALLAVPYNAPTIDLQVDANNKCIAAGMNFMTPGTSSYIWDCNAAWPNERWYPFVVPGTSSHVLINAYTGFCLAEELAYGTYVTQQVCANSNSLVQFTTTTEQTYWQSWKNPSTGLCLDGTGTTNGTNLGIVACNNSPAQMIYSFTY